MKKVFLTVFCAICFSPLWAQREQTVFSHAGGFSGFWGGLNYYGGSFGQKYGTYQGGHWGLEFGKAFIIGGNHYSINEERLNNSSNPNATFNLRSDGLWLGYSFLPSSAIHPNINVVGSRATLSLNDGSRDKVYTLEPSVGFELNLLRWCHLAVNGGYRFVADNDIVGFNDKNFSGAFAEAKLKFGWSWGSSTRCSSSKKDKK